MQNKRCMSQQTSQRKYRQSPDDNTGNQVVVQSLNRKVKRLQFRLKSGQKKQNKILKSVCQQSAYQLFVQQKRTIDAYQIKVQHLEKKLLQCQSQAKQTRLVLLLDQNSRLKAQNQELARTCSTLLAFNNRTIHFCLGQLNSSISKRDRKSVVKALRPRCMSLMKEQQVELQNQKKQLRHKVERMTKKNQKLQKELLQLFKQNQEFRKKVSCLVRPKPILINQEIQCQHELQQTSFSSLDIPKSPLKSAESEVDMIQLQSNVFRKIQGQERDEEILCDFEWNDKIQEKSMFQRKKQVRKEEIVEICQEIKYGMAYRNISMDHFISEFLSKQHITVHQIVDIIKNSKLVRFNEEQIQLLAKYLMQDKAPFQDTTLLKSSAIIKSIFRTVIGHVTPFRSTQATILNSLKTVIMANHNGLRQIEKKLMQVGLLRDWLGKQFSKREKEMLNLVRVCSCRRDCEVGQFIENLRLFQYKVQLQ